MPWDSRQMQNKSVEKCTEILRNLSLFPFISHGEVTGSSLVTATEASWKTVISIHQVYADDIT